MSSTSSNRADRNTRSNNKQGSPQKSATPPSLTSDDVSEQARTSTSEPPQTRRSKRQQDHKDDITKEEEIEEDEIVEDNEVTRCVCDNQDYPGPPIVDEDSEDIGEDVGGLFIQCDKCSVWQHGGCVGIMDDSMTPENYYCEECRPDYHKLMVNSIGQKYSRYLPVVGNKAAKSSHRKSSASKDIGRPTKKEREAARPATETLGKRRSTMNSRAAYDEDEMLRRVLEESKNEGQQGAGNSNRKPKRARADSEEYDGIRFELLEETTDTTYRPKSDPNPKRQKLESESESEEDSNTEMQSPDPDQGKGSSTRKQAARGAAARSQREKELRDREKERADAANKRKRRADQRRGPDGMHFVAREMALPFHHRRSRDSTVHSQSTDLDPAKANGKDGEIYDPNGSQPPDTPSVSGSLNDTTKKGKIGAGKRGRGRVAADTPTERGDGSPARVKSSKGGASSASPNETQVNGTGNDSGNGNGNGAEGSGPETNGTATNGTGKKSKLGAGGGTDSANGVVKTGGSGSGSSSRDGTKELSWSEMRRRIQAMLDGIATAEAGWEREEAFDDQLRLVGAPEAMMEQRVREREFVKARAREQRVVCEGWMERFGSERDRPGRGGGGASAANHSSSAT